MRRPYLAGNWKMNLDRRAARELAGALGEYLEANPASKDIDVGVFPASVYLDEIVRTMGGSRLIVGAQNCCDEEAGAYTGEVSVAMLRDVGASSVILGHSERRHLYGEADELIGRKVSLALLGGLDVILCVGETQEEREGGATEGVVATQLRGGLEAVSASDMDRITIAYEPVWAIGTGLTASPDQAQAVHAYLRGLLSSLYTDEVADSVRIQYGGSVKPSNAVELLSMADIDGALVGGAALTPENFIPILEAGLAAAV
ncbi:MAG: triose-phosphate isomerase [Planctomycetota bacterium]|nr:triose-phosphate isomerase [Planctomycetota bacterium]MDP6519362.1 triose-phosphate isomerase [Planctomycetota bacterium]MDP6956959.1 triose-phosphate isomerase [Planctomycetota bacterium]